MMEDLTKLMTELAEQKLEDITNDELNYLLDVCRLYDDKECFETFRTLQYALGRTLISFIEGVEYFGSTIDHEKLIQKSETLMNVFHKMFYEYMKARNS